MAKASREFEAVRPGDVYPSTIAVGEELTGRLAEIAAQLGALEAAPVAPPTKMSMAKAPSNRAAKRAPEVKA
jgi:hypothetical protein